MCITLRLIYAFGVSWVSSYCQIMELCDSAKNELI